MSTEELEKPDVKLNSVDEVIASMPARFHPENCQNFKATFQWELKNPDRTFHINVENGTFEINQGTHEKPNVRVGCDTEVYLKLVNGEMKDVIAVVTGKLSVKGSIATAQKMNRIFI